MEILFHSLIVAALTVIAYNGLRAIFYLWWKPRMLERYLRLQGIRGNSYRLIYGDMNVETEVIKEALSSPISLTHQIIPRAIPFPHKMVQKYGKICFLWSGTIPRLIIWDSELMKEVLNDKLGLFQKPPMNPHIKLLASGLSVLEGDEWIKRRKEITPAFHLEKLKGMVPAFLASCVDLMNRWQKLAGAEGSCELDVWPELQNMTGDVISRTAFGSNFEEGKRIFQLQTEQSVLVVESTRAPYFPGSRYIPTTNNRRRMQIERETQSIIRGIINKKRNAMQMSESVADDLLGLLLQSNGLNERELIEECKLFYFAGQETVSVLLTWTLILLSIHPEWQERAREEVLNKCGTSTPDFESIGALKTVTAILHEVLRLYPPVVSVFRHTHSSTKLGDLFIPAGVDLLLPTILIHHDPQIWGTDAEEFNPERFSEGILKATKGQSAFYPFGWGPRICVGQNFAMIEAKLALAIILQHFTFELSPSYAHAPLNIITLQPQLGAHVIIHRI